ncbi:hypothetical protein MXAN_5312 [Myxococcus xanthus DK 1622]|uniref:Uncharacterized protein n=1 Tax=Myxococcus xanthus (strain DK1622) TaxID=246197 RepID=Q1D1L0_MYXXD|nr:hypothetical protein MXAN_5312 [Myxococcus xanthus DK 1622]
MPRASRTMSRRRRMESLLQGRRKGALVWGSHPTRVIASPRAVAVPVAMATVAESAASPAAGAATAAVPAAMASVPAVGGAEAVLEEVRELTALPRVQRLVDLGERPLHRAAHVVDGDIVASEELTQRGAVEVLTAQRGAQGGAAGAYLITGLGEGLHDIVGGLEEDLLLAR